VNGDREEMLAAGRERLLQALLRVRHLHDECMAGVAEVERIRREVEAQTGVSLIAPPPLPDPDVVDAEFAAMMWSLFPEGTVG
jgi:hypothetical protein